MTGNDQKIVWEHHLGIGTIIFCDLGCPGRYSRVLERYFDVHSQDSKVGYGVDNLKSLDFFEKSQNFTK